jgi:[NiFe] hydrogenase assembly HybE family chaperone
MPNRHTHFRLESAFLQIQKERMKDVPVINHKLHTRAIGFRHWENYQFGILITPWFMNLILLPEANNNRDRNRDKVGSIHHHQFPSGTYEFVTTFEAEIGYYQSCSLFSPMFEFANQQAAELTAKQALLAMMDEENIDIASQHPGAEIQQLWKDEWNSDKPEQNSHQSDMPANTVNNTTRASTKATSRQLLERIQEPTSRRDFLRGKIFKEESRG